MQNPFASLPVEPKKPKERFMVVGYLSEEDDRKFSLLVAASGLSKSKTISMMVRFCHAHAMSLEEK